MVKRTGDMVSVITEYGLTVNCNFQSELCTVDISPFYFGQVNGMLGTFNNEPSDDYTSKGGVVIRNSEELAQSWMVWTFVRFNLQKTAPYCTCYYIGFTIWLMLRC